MRNVLYIYVLKKFIMKQEIRHSRHWYDMNETSILAKLEKNDCVVRAISSACDVSYEDAHSFVKDVFERPDKGGVITSKIKLSELSKALNISVTELGEIIPELNSDKKLLRRWYKKRGVMSWGKYTTERFLEKWPKGSFIVLVSGHSFAIKDGVIFGSLEDAKKLRVRINQAFRVEKL